MSKRVCFWRRIDVPGLERLELTIDSQRVNAVSSVLCMEDGGFRLDHCWHLSPDWRAQSVTVDRWNSQGHRRLCVERDGSGWKVDGEKRADLDLVDEPDLSVTPFCNTFPMRRVPEGAGKTLTLDTAFIDGSAMTVARSRQRYERIDATRLRYVDLGLSAGFTAELTIDELGLVLGYEHLFERVEA